jgi:predicted amidohydrolase
MLERTAEAGRFFNTSLLFDVRGEVVATYRKIHLFDVDLGPGPLTYRESETLLPGEQTVVAPLFDTRVGLSICYDLRFPELYRALSADGAEILFVPAAFTMQTGRDHWELLLRARAVENLAYVLAAGQVGEHPPGKSCYGRSMIVDPWGTVLAQAADEEGFVGATLDLERLRRIRRNLPALGHRRLGEHAAAARARAGR